MDEMISEYTAKRHYGMEYILQMHKLQHADLPTLFGARELLKSRQHFVSRITEVIERCDLQTCFEDFFLATDVVFTKSQLFIPRELFHLPGLVKAIKQDGRRDLLGRSIGHMLYDSKAANEPSHQLTHSSDVLVRTRLHMICVTGRFEKQDTNTLSTPVTWPGDTMLGLDALGLAAIHGNTEVFRLAQTSHYDLASRILTDRTFMKRTYLHWAAAYGHVELVEYLLEVFLASKLVPKQYLIYQDEKGDTALHLAAQHGHIQVVEVILHHTDWY
jgi:hypothetical protein